MIRRGTITKSASVDLATTLAHNLVSSYNDAVLEFASNSYDADASLFDIRVSTIDDLLIMEDDGTGMDEDGIVGFYRIGDSEKVTNPTSARGRKKIGKYGIGAILLEYLGGEYTLETWKDGTKITIRENFDDMRKGEIPKGVVESCSPDRHGTKITIRRLNLNTRNFLVDKLKTVLEWKAPCLPDYNIEVNGIRLPKRGVVTYCTGYLVDGNVSGVGEVNGSIFYNNRAPLDVQGIFIYVNGRAVGDPLSFEPLFKKRMRGKIIGAINADGLEEHIGIDRSRFREDSPEYLGVRKVIEEVLRSIETDTRNFIGSRMFWRSLRMIPKVEEALGNAEAQINRGLAEDGVAYRLELKLDEENPWISRKEGPVVYLNLGAPVFSIDGHKTSMHDSLQPAFVLYALQAIANEVVARDEGERSIILTVADAFTYEAGGSVFVDQRPVKDSVRRLFEKEQIVGRPLDQVELNPYRLYTLEEISMRSGWDINTVKRLYQAERLLPYQDGTEKRFRRGPILEALESVNGMSPATKVLLPDDYMSRFHITLKSRGHKLVPLERTLMGHPDRPAYLRDISTNEEMPYLWIPTGEVGHFRTWVTESKVA